MDPTAEQHDLDYLLGVAASQPLSTNTTLPAVPHVAPAPVSIPNSIPSGLPMPVVVPPTPTSSQPSSQPAEDTPANPKKRPLEEKKARDRKRVLRNRELARVSNERRKGRIKAMENELGETRKTVTTLEESIRCLEAENNELRKLLQGKNTASPTPPIQSASVPAAASHQLPTTAPAQSLHTATTAPPSDHPPTEGV
ncbi:hypothetical protein BWQ96_06368 [Gracilariopsis chorda]|uniref:BZIP domain-containing protein n=1 Tax=Gracilariopsis chorda TaxID=448386 RepID=A0A2V3IPA1_9FLOR|nr:hypothetical protein BWQ96_06368 [Gracilariopsis chorda]|eukprot:PXF43902.1 hypothetical protein BWQ96_06368 [Gracilariopsis chorda]